MAKRNGPSSSQPGSSQVAARLSSSRKKRITSFGIDLDSIDAKEYLEENEAGGFNLTRFLNKALQDYARKRGWIPASERKA